MLKNFKLGFKIMAGFGVVLMLLVIVAIAGYRSLSGVSGRAEKTASVDEMDIKMLELRQIEKNFMIHDDPSYVTKFDEEMTSLSTLIADTKNKFKDKTNKDQMDQVSKSALEYQAAFKLYTSFGSQEHETMEVMRARAKEALEGISAIVADKEKQLAADQTDVSVKDKLSKLSDSNRVIKMFLEAQEKRKRIYHFK